MLRPEAKKLIARGVEKPWGRSALPAGFPDFSGRRIGEIRYEAPDGSPMPLLVKYIFTSERLSIQVHPSNAQAAERGLPAGKSECWYIVSAEPGAVLGLGTREPIEAAALRAAALDGSIEALIDWKPVAPGDFFYLPAGTVHAVGAGVTLVEIQQNADVTYRLYDYGRPRELHVDDAVAVARSGVYAADLWSRAATRAGPLLTENMDFSVYLVTDARSVGAVRGGLWVAPLEGAATSGDVCARFGECLWVDDGSSLVFAPGTVAIVAGQSRET